MAYQMAATIVTLNVIYRLQAFSIAIRRTFVQHFTRFQLTAWSHGSSASAELLVLFSKKILGYLGQLLGFFNCKRVQLRVATGEV